MGNVQELLEANQWSRRSPLLLDEQNKPVATCPICRGLKQRGHDKECWLGQAISELDLHIKQLRELKSRVQGLKVNRDSILEENERFRAKLEAYEKAIKELRSEMEGKLDGINEALFQTCQVRDALSEKVTTQIDEIVKLKAEVKGLKSELEDLAPTA